ncbi:methyltransferase domain-containing protein [Streptacidiphilus sp. P02-A3a]|uniref:methyltransferase domain-containing protein n=1 Tax=Streptacidiphilus sp. P02-A3a TaxID=2704468 RepID=UPI0015F82387|nr:methyltransferase domain-containing protein [Streptacidiphilus sp. P02-A3a]QMU70541.1 methyltransferase domain-containing protein [Streptacidiphilus sp. P02-A3a]
MTDQVTAATAPVAEEVGRMYDRMTLLAADFLGAEAAHGYNAHLGYWDTPESEFTFEEATDRLTDVMAERLRISAGDRLLDVGCGVGAPAVRLARRTGAAVTGISVSQEQVARANELARSTSLLEHVSFQRADAMRLPFADASFDSVFALESMPHMPDRAQVLREMRRVLRPGGRIVLTDFYRRPAPAPDVHPLRRTMGSTTAQLDEYPLLLRAAGLRFTEMLDITDETVHRSFAFLAEQAERMRLKLENPEATCYFNPQAVIDAPLLGYLLVVARRPERG